ncbi:Actin-related protein 4 [Lachnellula cervina]|uniref:Actin-related protein 4 n=1 Tax=Lachnellula cervina TaxID=1316786 RepID=A0A7D8UTN2_9HELO|nr:Actin-related protein 4 [Lachnellula cervina]
MSSASGPAHRSVANIRSPPTATANSGSPHTPLRTISSAFGSPSALRAEEDYVVIELGARYFKAGFAGDAVPKAVLDYGPEERRRAGDYRKWNIGYEKEWRKRIQGKEWGEAYELWRPELRGLDLGLIGDKIDRAFREAFTKYLLIDSRPRRLMLVLPSVLPLPLVSTVLDTLFTNYQPPTVSLMSAPALTAVAAGLRSALVVDIGWSETVVSSIYEYREVQCTRSVRGTKMLGEEMFTMLAEVVDPTSLPERGDERGFGEKARDILSFEECEEILTRMAWCKPGGKPEQPVASFGLTPVKEEDELRSSMRTMNISGDEAADPKISIPLRSTNPPQTLKVPFSKLAEPCEIALFGKGKVPQHLDDEELPIHLLVYRSLLKLPLDVRSICMSRIIFVGGGSNMPGLKGRILNEVAALIEQRGWDIVQGKAVDQFRNNPKVQRTRSRQADEGPAEVLRDSNLIPPGLLNQEPDPIEDDLRREAKNNPPVVSGNLRAIDSLGAWAGGSLLSQLKIPAVSIIDRDQWIQQGPSGASRNGEVTVTTQRQSMGPGAFKSAAGDRSSWTLGLWG